MEMNQGYVTYAARLASFEAAQPAVGKKKGSKTLKWPHKSPTPAELSLAGFFWRPSASNPDNTQCFLCERALDGWDEQDSAVEEHLKHSPECGWAVVMSAAQDGLDAATMEDPTNERLQEARRATFISWPHEPKRAWLCKIDRMSQAGWHFAPVPESDDFVSCAYCKLSLDGWEPKDSPFDEHYRRSPDCLFFAYAGTTAPKLTRGKKARSSKASRMSTQSNLTVASEVPSIPDLEDSIDGSVISVASVASTASKTGSKKTAKSRGKTKRTSKLAAFEAAESFEDQHPAAAKESTEASTTATGSRKRTSDHISEDGRGDRESTVKPEPLPKRRNTRNRSSVVEGVEHPIFETEPVVVKEEQELNPARGSRKRASSRARKTSAASTASLRAAIPDNAAIEAALEADLDRIMSDEEQATKVEQPKKTKGRKQKTSIASTAPMRAGQVSEEPEVPALAEVKFSQEPEIIPAKYDTEVEGSTASRSRSTKAKAPKKMPVKQTTQTKRGSNESVATVAKDMEPPIDSSMLTARTEADDSGHETDASVGGNPVARKGSKRKAAGKGRPQKAGTGIMSTNIEDVVHSQLQGQTLAALAAAAEPEPGLAAAAERDVGMEVDESVPAPDSAVAFEEVAKKPTKPTSKSTKAKATKPKKTKAQDKPPQLSMPGAFSPLMQVPDQDVEPSFASVLSPTSPVVVLATSPRPPITADNDSPATRRIAPELPPRSPFRGTTASARPTPTPQRVMQQATQESTPSPSPQSSDAENAPPSSRPLSTRPPLSLLSPSKNQVLRIPLAPGTPRAVPLSPSKIGGGLRSEIPWTSVDVEMVFANTPAVGKENVEIFGKIDTRGEPLTSPEKKMTVEEWINWNAQQAGEKLRAESERVVGVFEKEGGRALRVLEGIDIAE